MSDEDNSDSEPNFFEDLEIVYYHSEIQMYYGEQHSDGYIEYIISFSATIERCYQFLFEIFFNQFSHYDEEYNFKINKYFRELENRFL